MTKSGLLVGTNIDGNNLLESTTPRTTLFSPQRKPHHHIQSLFFCSLQLPSFQLIFFFHFLILLANFGAGHQWKFFFFVLLSITTLFSFDVFFFPSLSLSELRRTTQKWLLKVVISRSHQKRIGFFPSKARLCVKDRSMDAYGVDPTNMGMEKQPGNRRSGWSGLTPETHFPRFFHHWR